jgi:hypothetical protein
MRPIPAEINFSFTLSGWNLVDIVIVSIGTNNLGTSEFVPPNQ